MITSSSCRKVGYVDNDGIHDYANNRKVYSPYALSPTLLACNSDENNKSIKVIVYGK